MQHLTGEMQLPSDPLNREINLMMISFATTETIVQFTRKLKHR